MTMCDIFRQHRRKPDRRTRIALPVADWPDDDRCRWEAAFTAGSWCDRAGSGSHLRPATRTAWENSYGMWLGSLQQHHPASMSQPLEFRVTRERIKFYCEQLAKTNSALSIAIQLEQMRFALKLLSPEVNWGWLALIAKRIRARAVARPKAPRQQEIEKLAALGFK